MTIDDETRFHSIADRALASLFDALEAALGDEVDVDLRNGILTLELSSGAQYVINKHAPNRQIWLSSPVSGAAHFDFDEQRGWHSSRGGESLGGVLERELVAATGVPVDLG